tara:strand:- start:48 stop:329 length:282 start_codon:yes stop_codon:yes gene_type:complete
LSLSGVLLFRFRYQHINTQSNTLQDVFLIHAPLSHLIDVQFDILYNTTMEKKRVPISLTEDQHKALEQAAAAMGLTISSYIRLAALERVKRDA